TELEKNHFNAAAIVLQLLLATLDQVITILDTKLHAVRDELHRAPHTPEVAALTGELQRLQSRWADFDRYSSAARGAVVGVEAVPGMDPRQPIDVKWKTKGNANYDLSVAINVDRCDLLSPPVREPNMAVAPTWRFTHRKTRQQDLDFRFQRLF